MSPLPTGPVITVTYFAPSGLGTSQLSFHLKTAAAAVLLPILVVIGAIVIWDKIERQQGNET